MEKAPLKSMTFWGAMLFSVVTTAEQMGVVPAGGTQSIADLLQGIATFLGVFGIRRALG